VLRTLHHRTDGHHGWDRDRPPALEVEPGAVVELALADAFGGQLGPDASGADVAALDLGLANPLTGPIAVRGGVPGDALVVEVLDVAVGSVGWTTLIPGFGLLADHFPEPYALVSTIEDGRVRVADLAELPARPFVGTVGVAPAEPGSHSVIPPRRVGGNLDCRDVRPGVRLVLPLEVEGALLSVGDPHAAQGDGEVCGTAIETTATTVVRLELRPGAAPRAPVVELPAETPAPRGRRLLTTGVGPDLYAGARAATLEMIDRLGVDHGLDAADAYALCSVAADLRIVEIVDAPNWVVGCELDLAVLG
jgi:acetamidase/formamidase